MLFASGEGEHISALSACVDSLANQSPCHLAHKLIFGSEKTQVRSTVREGDTQGLTFTGDNIRPKLTWRGEQAQRDRVYGDREKRACLVRCFSQSFIVQNPTKETGYCYHQRSLVIDDGRNASGPLHGSISQAVIIFELVV
jgi:hypothetical protein